MRMLLDSWTKSFLFPALLIFSWSFKTVLRKSFVSMLNHVSWYPQLVDNFFVVGMTVCFLLNKHFFQITSLQSSISPLMLVLTELSLVTGYSVTFRWTLNFHRLKKYRLTSCLDWINLNSSWNLIYEGASLIMPTEGRARRDKLTFAAVFTREGTSHTTYSHKHPLFLLCDPHL